MRPWAGSRRWRSRRRGSVPAPLASGPPGVSSRATRSRPGAPSCARSAAGAATRSSSSGTRSACPCWWPRSCGPTTPRTPSRCATSSARATCSPGSPTPSWSAASTPRAAGRSRTCCWSTSRARRCRRCWTATAPIGLEQLLPLGMHVAAALHYLAHEGVVHLDVKPDNLVMGAPPRLIDFSVSRGLISAGRLSKPVGTDAYMAPEQCDRTRGELGPPVDVFGLGATMFRAMTGGPRVPARPGRRALAGPGDPLPAARRARRPRCRAAPRRRWPSCWRRCSPRRPATARRPRRSSPRSSRSSRSCRGGSCSAAAAAQRR